MQTRVRRQDGESGNHGAEVTGAEITGRETNQMGVSYRHSAGFGKRMEYYLIGQMLREGLDVYVPLVDDHGVDAVVKREDGSFIEIQIKARSSEVAMSEAALFAAITHGTRVSAECGDIDQSPDKDGAAMQPICYEPVPNFYFVFYSDRLQTMWIMSSEEFLQECDTNRRPDLRLYVRG